MTRSAASYTRLVCNGILEGILGDIEVLACPSMTTASFPVAPEESYGPIEQETWTWGRCMIPYDFSGAPTTWLPRGSNDEGLAHGHSVSRPTRG